MVSDKSKQLIGIILGSITSVLIGFTADSYVQQRTDVLYNYKCDNPICGGIIGVSAMDLEIKVGIVKLVLQTSLLFLIWKFAGVKNKLPTFIMGCILNYLILLIFIWNLQLSPLHSLLVETSSFTLINLAFHKLFQKYPPGSKL